MSETLLKDSLKDRPILVTGAAGCIGAWTVKTLTDIGAVPIVMDVSDNRRRLELIMHGAETVIWEAGDITDYERLCQLMRAHNISAIIHLAALQVPFCKADPIKSVNVNVVGTAHILEAARAFDIKRLAYASSIAAPAMAGGDWLPTLYGAHKVCGEHMAAVYWQDWNVPSICIRPGVIYGPARDQGMSAAPTLAMLAAMYDIPYTIPFTGPVSFVHAEDAAMRFIGSISNDIQGAHIFDMRGTPETMENVLRTVTADHPKSKITLSGGALPFPYAADDGRLDALIKAAPYRTFKDGISQSYEVFRDAIQCGKLDRERVEKLLGGSS